MQKQIPRKKPSQKQKKRYVLFSLKTEKKIWFEELSKQLWLAIIQGAGKEDALALGFQLVLFDSNSCRGIFKCKREQCACAIEIINSIKEIADAKAAVKTISTSGTIKTLKEKI